MSKSISLLQREREQIDLQLKHVLNSLQVAQQSVDHVKEEKRVLVLELADINQALKKLGEK